jgi:hypothetical protein
LSWTESHSEDVCEGGKYGKMANASFSDTFPFLFAFFSDTFAVFVSSFPLLFHYFSTTFPLLIGFFFELCVRFQNASTKQARLSILEFRQRLSALQESTFIAIDAEIAF